jgi:hypothetical protein
MSSVVSAAGATPCLSVEQKGEEIEMFYAFNLFDLKASTETIRREGL